MLKKVEVIEALENGAHILVNDIYRSATVWKDGHRLGTCRFDTAQRLAKVTGYTVENLEAWSFSWRIEKQRPEPEENDGGEVTYEECAARANRTLTLYASADESGAALGEVPEGAEVRVYAWNRL
jgi:hypothetical protein